MHGAANSRSGDHSFMSALAFRGLSHTLDSPRASTSGDVSLLNVTRKTRGFITQNLYVPNASGSRLEFDTSLQPIGPGNYIEINKIIKLTLLAERQIMQKQYDDALKSADAIKLINDNIAAAWEIEGAAYFVKGDLVKSKIAWTRSLDIDPDNPDTVQILKSINGKPTEK